MPPFLSVSTFLPLRWQIAYLTEFRLNKKQEKCCKFNVSPAFQTLPQTGIEPVRVSLPTGFLVPGVCQFRHCGKRCSYGFCEKHTRSALSFQPRINGRRWIRTTEANCSRFTVCPLWPLGNPPILSLDNIYLYHK